MRFGFWWKGAILIVLVVLFDRLVSAGTGGVVVAGFALAWLVGMIAGRRDVRHSRRAWIAAGAAGLFVVSLADDPGVLAWALFWCALSMAALLPRTAGFDSAAHWTVRLMLHGLTGIGTVLRDVGRLAAWRSRNGSGVSGVATTLSLPVIGGALFMTLFASANPLIARAFARIELPSFWQILLWGFGTVCIWPALRPHAATIRLAARMPDPEPRLPGTSLTSVLLALALFNAIFAVQNILDIAFLWSGAALPAGTTQTDYVHRGAYPLIATALIAGFLTLAMLRPDRPSARHPLARRLVTLWVVQNIVLVASSALRTVDYVAMSMLTTWRIAALLWMALVAFGLATILWRILAGRSARWLVDRNMLAALIVLVPCTFVDFGAVAARWNVRTDSPEHVDLCYLQQVGPAALLPLIELERRPLTPVKRDRVRAVRERVLADLSFRQRDWRSWTPRGARLLTLAMARLGPDRAMPVEVRKGAWQACDGSTAYAEPGTRP